MGNSDLIRVVAFTIRAGARYHCLILISTLIVFPQPCLRIQLTNVNIVKLFVVCFLSRAWLVLWYNSVLETARFTFHHVHFWSLKVTDSGRCLARVWSLFSSSQRLQCCGRQIAGWPGVAECRRSPGPGQTGAQPAAQSSVTAAYFDFP